MRGDTQSIALNKRVAPSGVPLFGRLSLFWVSTVPPSAFPLFPLPVFHLRPCGFPLAPLPGFQCGFPCGFNVVSRGFNVGSPCGSNVVPHVVSMWFPGAWMRFPMWFQCGFPCGFNVVSRGLNVISHVVSMWFPMWFSMWGAQFTHLSSTRGIILTSSRKDAHPASLLQA